MTKESSNHVLVADQYAEICMNVMGDSYRIAHSPQSIDICHEGGFLKKLSFPANHLELIGDW